MAIILNHSSMTPIYEQLVDNIKKEIIAGNLKSGDALDSVRTLSAKLRISALTVKKAYDCLESEGVIVTVHGKGSYVSDNNMELLMEAKTKEVETKLEEAINKAKVYGLSKDDLYSIIDILMEDYK